MVILRSESYQEHQQASRKTGFFCSNAEPVMTKPQKIKPGGSVTTVREFEENGILRGCRFFIEAFRHAELVSASPKKDSETSSE